MDVVHGHALVATPPREAVVSIGNFDGVHLGHQALLGLARERAKTRRGVSVAYTFEPHPVRILNPSLAPFRLTPPAEKVRLIGEQGVDVCIVEPFTAAFASMAPEAFVEDVLVSRLGVRELVVGHDFTYGKGGAGNIATLEQAARRYGFELHAITPQHFGGVVASSTKIREFLLEGKVDGAAMLLGRPYAMEGTVVHGDARGRSLGFPTANLATDFELFPRYGVYACWAVAAPHTSRAHRVAAVVNIGLRPTVRTDAAPTVEAHLFDFGGDLYDQRLRLDFMARIRDEQRFASLDALKQQIAADADRARQLLGV